MTEDMNDLRISAEADKRPAGDRELLIFGEGDGALSKDTGVKYTKPKLGYLAIALLGGIVLGAAVTILAVSSITGGLSNLRLIKNMGKYDSSVISELMQKIDAYHFGDTPSSDKLVEEASHALVDAVDDPYASYFTEKEYNDYSSSFNGRYCGIGVLVQKPDSTGSVIVRVYEDSFAEQAGVKAGDVIIKVDDKEVKDISSNELVDLITGEAGTTVDLTVLRDDRKLTITVTRGEVYVKRVDSMMLEDNVGYIYLSQFSGDAVKEFETALNELTEQGAKSLIIDLRNDPGGALNIAVELCDMMLPECVICSMQGKTTEETEYFRSDKEMYDIPFIVLVNENSASASEIFAGAMQDNGRAKIIGVQTFGKGVVQTTFRLDNGHGYLKLTTDAYYTPNGTNLGGTGITPDIAAELPEELKTLDVYTLYTQHLEEDTQIQAALKELKNN
ncbi:MAG: S41 family peptidase [Clostridia bacterium]|nr:S41 family peptidase [Clostridia bacterium]